MSGYRFKVGQTVSQGEYALGFLQAIYKSRGAAFGSDASCG